MQDLTQYSDNELSLQVFNDEYLYNFRHVDYLEEILEELFLFTDEQLHVLKGDLADDLEEC